ncbi:MAG: DUF1932 domain-containing protein [Pseudomonadales bacterium]
MKIGVLHPGAMGVTVAATLAASGHEVCWVAAGRSAATAARAASVGLQSLADLDELARCCDGVISVCPPAAALELAGAVVAAGFAGTYVDGNAISPASARQIHALVGPGFVDGGIVGPPALRPGSTRLYLSGPRAGMVADWFAAGPLQAVAMNEALHGSLAARPGAASALKMAYAAYTKGSSALLLAVRALAEAEGVAPGLLGEWSLSQQGLAERAELTARATAAKAWRFVGEMEEIAATFEAAGLPGAFHLGAADLYRRLATLKDAPDATLAEVLELLTGAVPEP